MTHYRVYSIQVGPVYRKDAANNTDSEAWSFADISQSGDALIYDLTPDNNSIEDTSYEEIQLMDPDAQSKPEPKTVGTEGEHFLPDGPDSMEMVTEFYDWDSIF